MMSPIRVGLIGANPDEGWAHRGHLPALQALSQYELVAVSTTRMESATRSAEQFGARLAFDNALDLIRHPDVEMVTIAVKAPLQHDLVVAAAEAGKHIYCEWPFGGSLEQSVAMADAVRDRPIHTAVGLQGRVSPWINAIRDLVASGKLGRIVSTSVITSGAGWGGVAPARSIYMLDRESGATMLTIPFGHLVDTIVYCLDEISELSALLKTQRAQIQIEETGEMKPMTAADQIAVNGVLRSGAVLSMHTRSGMSRGTNFLWEINGTEGDLVVTAETPFVNLGPLDLKLGRGSATTLEDVPVSGDVPDVPAALKGGPAYHPACLYANFARDIREGTSLCASFEDALVRRRLLDLIHRSNKLGKRLDFTA